MVRVFLSSTSQDLEAYREGAIEICNRLQVVPVAMEFFEAMGVGASKGSTKKIDECDVYVGFFAHRYGFVEPGYPTSVTEVEFDYAGSRGVERLCFIVDPNYNWPGSSEPEAKGELDAFKSRVGTLIRDNFTTVEDFKLKLYQSLDTWLKDRRAMRSSLRDIFDPLFFGYRLFGAAGTLLTR